MFTSIKVLKQVVKVTDVQWTDASNGIVTVLTRMGNLVSASFCGNKFMKGEQVEVEFSSLDNPISWKAIFLENKEHKLMLEPTSEKCQYFAYGKILSLYPIIANFGDIKLSLGDWTHDERVIGEFVYWNIGKLNIEPVRH